MSNPNAWIEILSLSGKDYILTSQICGVRLSIIPPSYSVEICWGGHSTQTHYNNAIAAVAAYTAIKTQLVANP